MIRLRFVDAPVTPQGDIQMYDTTKAPKAPPGPAQHLVPVRAGDQRAHRAQPQGAGSVRAGDQAATQGPVARGTGWNVLSLFSGIGGLELGLERAGMTVVGQVEIDPFCRRVLAKHWPEVPRHDDVRTAVQWWRGAPRPAVHVVAGGFPCQGHSVAGKRLGTGDERWGWPWFRTVAAEFAPAWIVIENVPNLARTGLDDVLRDLADLGFDAWWGSVPAAALGAPHLRWRLFVVAAHPERVQLRHQPGRLGGPDGSGTTIVGHDGTAWSLADPDVEARRREAGHAVPRPGGGALPAGQTEPRRRSDALADTDGARLEGPGRLHDPATGGWTRPVPANGCWWAVEPDVGRVAHGVPARVDRLRALGNAVVPQVAEHIGRLIMAASC